MLKVIFLFEIQEKNKIFTIKKIVKGVFKQLITLINCLQNRIKYAKFF